MTQILYANMNKRNKKECTLKRIHLVALYSGGKMILVTYFFRNMKIATLPSRMKTEDNICN
jgi:hypothetical protein